MLAERVVLAHRERYWPRAALGPSDERSCVSVTGCGSPGHAGGLWPIDPRST